MKQRKLFWIPHKKSWRNDKQILNADILPQWKNRPLREVMTKRTIRELLQTIIDRGAPIHANRVHVLLSKLCAFAVDQDVLENNPVRDVRKPSKERIRERVLTPEEIRTFWQATGSMPAPLRALWRLRLLTAQRPQEEVAQLQWGEVDLEAAWWTIPSGKTKNKLAHRVPLSTPAVELLRELRAEEEPAPEAFVFKGYTRDVQTRSGKHLPLDDFQPGTCEKPSGR